MEKPRVLPISCRGPVTEETTSSVVNSVPMITIITLLKKTKEALMMSPCLSYHSSDGSDENFDGEGDLEIDLDYNDYTDLSIREQAEPLDLSVKKISHDLRINKLKLPKIWHVRSIMGFQGHRTFQIADHY